jgi:hypothetical protein
MSEQSPKFLSIRTEILKCLIKLAGAEPRPPGRVARKEPELTDEQRQTLLSDALGSLEKLLPEFSRAFPDWREVVRSNLEDHAKAVSNKVLDEKAKEDFEQAVRTAAAIIQPLLEEVRVPQVGETKDDGADQPRDAKPKVDPKRLGEIPVIAQKPISELINDWCPIPRIFVAVHGIGDQALNATVQSVAFQVCQYVGVPAALPLGRFHGPGTTVTGAFLPEPDRDPPIDCGFAEIYWADVPRGPAADQHILEEPTRWARTLVERLRLRAPEGPPRHGRMWKMLEQFMAWDESADAVGKHRERRDDERLEQLLQELIQGVSIADRLVFLAEKAGLFKFDLKKLLNDYLNDVQVVAEFEDYRNELLDVFNDVLEKIHRYFGKSEIYVVAHSEGTVVAFMGLLKGLANKHASWPVMVRGMMTIGSPLNKHVRFWPELFDQFKSDRADKIDYPIRWKNYYDYGDPVGYDLQPVRDWMDSEGWDPFFDFKPTRDDIGFTRYFFPGAAHNDYWRDTAVFGHFIDEVVNKPPSVSPGGPPPQAVSQPLPSARREAYGAPQTVGVARLTSWVLPYILAALLLFLACYLLYKAVRAWLDPIGATFETPWEILLNVGGLAALIAGMTMLARIPRLSNQPRWRLLSYFLGLLSLGYLLMSADNRRNIEQFLSDGAGLPSTNSYNILLFCAVIGGVLLNWRVKGLRAVIRTIIPVILLVLCLRLAATLLDRVLEPRLDPLAWTSIGVILLAWTLGLAARYTSWRFPQSGTKPLVHTGGLIILLIIATQVAGREPTLMDHDHAALAKAFDNQDREAVKVLNRRIQEEIELLPGRRQDRVAAALDRIVRSETPESVKEKQRIAIAADFQIIAAALNEGPIWPVFLAGFAFLYLWWLAIVAFDLTFVWHVYIRYSGAQTYLNRRLKAGDPASIPAVTRRNAG